MTIFGAVRLARTVSRRTAKRIVSWILMPALEQVLRQDSRNIERWRQRQALADTARFVEAHLSGVSSYPDAFTLLTHAIAQMDKAEDGLVCEFGVATGRTINHIAAALPGRTVYGFDSFEGLPEDWRDGFPQGMFKRQQLPKVRPAVRLISGWFSDTLPGFLERVPGNMSFLHIDCDLYSSTSTVFEHLASRIQPGTVIVFDEYFNYPGWREGEYKAFMEFIEKAGVTFRYLGYCRYNEQVAVRISVCPEGAATSDHP